LAKHERRCRALEPEWLRRFHWPGPGRGGRLADRRDGRLQRSWRSGILWRDANGDTELWNANGSGGFTGEDLGVVGPSWHVAGTGDFTGTGEDSVLWQNSNGDTELWNANGSGGFTGEDLGVVSTSWSVHKIFA
jgi:hypothetical protein